MVDYNEMLAAIPTIETDRHDYRSPCFDWIVECRDLNGCGLWYTVAAFTGASDMWTFREAIHAENLTRMADGGPIYDYRVLRLS